MTTQATTDHDDGLLLPGLDGTNPLGFLAALGTIRTLSIVKPDQSPAMSWHRGAGWHPRITCPAIHGEAELIATLMRYNEDLKCVSTDRDATAFDMTSFGDIIGVSPEVFATFQEDAWRYSQLEPRTAPRREALDFVAGYGTSFCLSDKGNVEPTRFSFANGQSGQCLLRSFRKIRDSLTPEDLVRTLSKPWMYTDERPTMRWDPVDCRPYAHLATNPGDSKETPIRTMRGANYLAFLALPMLPTVPTGEGLQTTGFLGGGGCWTWPIWEAALNADCIRSLLTLPDLKQEPVDTAKLNAASIAHVCRSRRYSYQKGVYFSPSTPI